MRDCSRRRRFPPTCAASHTEERGPAVGFPCGAPRAAISRANFSIQTIVIMFIDSNGRLRPAWAFVLSAMLSCGAFVAVGYLAAALAGDHVLRFEAIFRPLLAIVLLGIFSWLLTVANHVEEHRVAAQGLPLSLGWA